MPPDRFIESRLPEMPHPDHRYPASDQAAGRLSADRQVWVHRLPRDRRRGRRSAARTFPTSARSGPTSRTSRPRTPRSGWSSGSPTRTRFVPIRGCRGSTALSNNAATEDWPKNFAEIYAITHYLYAKSTPPADFTDPPAATDPAKGKELFLQKGCLACHQHRPYAEEDIQQADKVDQPGLQARPCLDVRPQELPGDGPAECPRRFRPESLEHGRQVRRQAAGTQVAVELDPGARAIPPQEPDAQPPAHAGGSRPTSRAGSCRCRANGRSTWTCWPPDSKEVKEAVDELVKLYVSKSGSFKTADGKSVVKSLERDRRVRHQGAQDRRQTVVPGRTDDLAAGLLRLPHHPRLRDRQADRHRAQRLGNQEPRPARLRSYRRILDRSAPRRERRSRRHRPLLPREDPPRDPDGLPLSEAAPAAQLRLLEEEREIQGVGRPAAHAPVRLGQRSQGDRGGDDLRARLDRRKGQCQVSARRPTRPRPRRPSPRAPRS